MLDGTKTYIHPEVEGFVIEGWDNFHIGWFLVNHVGSVGDFRHCLGDIVESEGALRPATCADFHSE